MTPTRGDACALWCCAIRHAVLTGELNVPGWPAAHRPATAAPRWEFAVEVAEASQPSDFPEQRVGGRGAAGCLVVSRTHLYRGMIRRGYSVSITYDWLSTPAVRGGGDTDTVAPSRGGLLRRCVRGVPLSQGVASRRTAGQDCITRSRPTRVPPSRGPKSRTSAQRVDSDRRAARHPLTVVCGSEDRRSTVTSDESIQSYRCAVSVTLVICRLREHRGSPDRPRG